MPRRRRASLRKTLAVALTAALIATASVFGVAVPVQAADGSASLTWGIKQSFVSYISGPIAHGSISTSGNASGTYPFTWTAGASTLNADASAGSASFTGAVAFTGHGGQLDVTVANPRVEVSGTTGMLFADVVSKSLSSGQPVSYPGVALAALTLPAPSISAGVATWTGVSASLTAAGVPAFAEFYAAGTALDFLSLSAPVAAPAPTATSTTLAVSPAGSAPAGTNVTLTATVAPDAAGSVEFFDGSISLGTAPVAAGTASTSVSTLTAGEHSLSAAFTPADTTAFIGSAADAVPYSITAAPQPEQPRVVVSKTADLDPAGEVVTVTGSGFLPHPPETNGTRPPLKDSFSGAYIAFGSFAGSTWTGASRAAATTKWAVPEESLSAIGGTDAGGVVLNADGTFTAEISVKNGDAPNGGTWGIRTYAAGGATYSAFETFTPIAFAAAEPEPEPEPEPADPTLSVTPSADLDPTVANILTVTGAGFTGPGAANGAYVLFGETSVWSGSGPLPSDGWIAQAWVQPAQISEGRFTTTLSIPAGRLDPAKSYHVATSAAHALSATDRSLDAFSTVTVAAPAPGPKVVIGNAGASVTQGGVLEVTGTGFAPGDVVTATAFSDPVVIGSTTASALGVVTFSWLVPADFPAGPHTLELAVGGVAAASVPFTVTASALTAAESPQQPSCVAQAVAGATLQWGVRESFRAYVTGPIARGAITGGWGSGAGAYNTDADRGRVSYGGSIHYTGHGGLLDVTLSDPRIQITGASSASLLLNVQSRGFNGSPDVNAAGVVFATLSLPAATETDSRISWSGASATLTAAGAAAFAGFYSAGEALDPVSFAFPLGAEVACDRTTDAALAATGGDQPLDLVWLGAGMLVLGAGLFVLRRRMQRV